MTNVSSTTGRGLGQSLQALHNRDYRWYWFAGLGMSGSQGIQQLALGWLVLDLTGSAGQLGLVTAMQGLPMTVTSLFGGVLADRYDRKMLLQLSQAFTFANLLLLGMLTSAGMIQVWHLYFFAIGLGLMQAVTMPARQALIRSLVTDEEMMNAVALASMQLQSSRIIWPTTAGLLIGTLGVGVALIISAMFAAAGILCLFLVHAAPFVPVLRPTSPMQDVIEGVRYTFGHEVVGRVITLSICIASLGLAFLYLGVGFAREELHFTAGQTGLFLMCSGIGAIVASLLMVVLQIRATVTRFAVAAGGFALSLVLLCINPWTGPAFFFMVGYGFFNSGMAITGQTIFQIHVPQRLLGRVISLWSMGAGLAALTSWPIGAAGDMVGLRWSLGSSRRCSSAWHCSSAPARSRCDGWGAQPPSSRTRQRQKKPRGGSRLHRGQPGNVRRKGQADAETTPPSVSAAISASLKPFSRRIASVSAPGTGAGVRTLGGVRSRVTARRSRSRWP